MGECGGGEIAVRRAERLSEGVRRDGRKAGEEGAAAAEEKAGCGWGQPGKGVFIFADEKEADSAPKCPRNA